jgi:hypothetical protein
MQGRKAKANTSVWGRPGRMDEKGFINTRARFQRMTDAKFFAGWVKDFSMSSIHVSLAYDANLEPGQQFMFEVHGHSVAAVFPAELSVVSGDDLVFSIPQPLRLVTPNEEARVYVRDVTGILKGETMEVDVLVVDVSKKGAGVLAPMPLAAGERITLELDTLQGPVICCGEVRYCRPDSREWGQFRAGILLDDMGRIERARWARLVGFNPAA